MTASARRLLTPTHCGMVDRSGLLSSLFASIEIYVDPRVPRNYAGTLAKLRVRAVRHVPCRCSLSCSYLQSHGAKLILDDVGPETIVITSSDVARDDPFDGARAHVEFPWVQRCIETSRLWLEDCLFYRHDLRQLSPAALLFACATSVSDHSSSLLNAATTPRSRRSRWLVRTV